MRKVLAYAIFMVSANVLVQAGAPFYVQFNTVERKTILGRAFGPDDYGKPKWRLYNCTAGTSTGSSFNHSTSGSVTCTRVRMWFPVSFRRWKFYKRVNFLKTPRGSVDCQFPDTKPEQVPDQVWVGFEHPGQCPRLKPTPEAQVLAVNETKEWISAVPDPDARQNLVAFLAAPDLSWASKKYLKDAYLRSYVSYVLSVIEDYDIFLQHRPNITVSDDYLEWRGPRWLDWRGMKSARKIFNRYWRGWDQMHRMWMWRPEMENRLRKMIPVLAGKMVDPCFLNPTSDPRPGARSRTKFAWDFTHSLCGIYCRFSQAVNFLYPTTATLVCGTVGLQFNQGRCLADQCLCIIKTYRPPHREFGYPIPLRFCINAFNAKRYNETHSTD